MATEDMDIVRDLIAQAIESVGHEPGGGPCDLCLETADAVMALISRHPFALVLADDLIRVIEMVDAQGLDEDPEDEAAVFRLGRAVRLWWVPEGIERWPGLSGNSEVDRG